MRSELAIFSHGGGVQSTAALVLTAQGEPSIPRIHLFCNVGDDSENPATLRYVQEVSKPYAAANGIELIELARHRRDGAKETILGRLTKPGTQWLSIPVRMGSGMPVSRTCTVDFKIRVIAKWLKDHGASQDRPAHVALGISADEIHRAHPGRDPRNPEQIKFYPLLDLGLHRSDCLEIIRKAGLPQPPRSACWFCPFHRPSAWSEMRRDDAALFEQAADLEDDMNRRRRELGRTPVYLTRFMRPLREAIAEAGPELFDPTPDLEECDEGVCFV